MTSNKKLFLKITTLTSLIAISGISYASQNADTRLGSLVLETSLTKKCTPFDASSRINKSKIFGINEHILSQIQKAQKYQVSNNFEDAQRILNKTLEDKQISSPERAMVHKSLFETYMLQDDTLNGIKHLEESIDYTPDRTLVKQKSLLTLAKLYASQENYEKSSLIFERWLKGESKPNSKELLVYAAVNSELKRHQDSICVANFALSLKPEKPKQLLYLLYQGHDALNDENGKEEVKNLLASL